ncbi:MAG: nicotinate (nicotinamide) nucleotide adenylyltransferase [Erysipelothrix sp.]|nr:nicotinate (nicotinamide) nucleotide adenylyltransferase [Erysipelothrix sp.]
MKKIGLFGGSFDPVHSGHIELSKTVLKELSLDEVWLIPAFDQPLKSAHVETFENRVKLLKVATKHLKNLKVCEIEKELSTPSYTYNTVKRLMQTYPNNIFVWIIGDDQIEHLNKWYKIDELLNMVEFIVVNRNEVAVEDRFKHVDFKHNASSSAVRAGNFNMLPKVVVEMIYEHHLYFPHILKEFLSKERAEHTLRCVDVALEIGAYYNVEKTDLYKAVILHDITKELDKETELEIMEKYFPQYLNLNSKVYHQYTAAIVAKKFFRITDDKILAAIKSHTTGDNISLLAMITYVADKLERGRSYEVDHYIEMCKENIYKGFKVVRRDAKKARKLKGI